MANIPAVCDSCGRLFPTGFSIGANFSAEMINCGAGPCPFCGSKGKIQDGIYSTLSNTALLFTSGKILPSHLKNLISILNSSLDNKKNYQEVADTINNDIPELTSIADILPKTRKELYAFLVILIALATLLLNTCKSDTSPPSVTNHNVSIFVNQAIELSYRNDNDIGHKTLKTPKKTIEKKTKLKKKQRRKIAAKSKSANRKKR